MPVGPTTRGGRATGVVAGRAVGELDAGGGRLEARGQQDRDDEGRLLPDAEVLRDRRPGSRSSPVPTAAVEYVAGLVKVPTTELAKYDLAGAKRHRSARPWDSGRRLWRTRNS